MDSALKIAVARKVLTKYAEEAANLWFAHDVGEIDDLEFLAEKKRFFERASKELSPEDLAGVGGERVKEIRYGKSFETRG